MNRPRLMVSGERSGVGKSTITVGIIAALNERGLDVQPFKTGPDFLDPMHHNEVTERRSRNLDTWMFPGWVPYSFQSASAGADVSLVEGVMGLFDGFDGRSEEGSSAHLSKVLHCPVILVVDASATSRSAGALVKGFKTFDEETSVMGVIFNRVGGRRHLDMVEDSIQGLGLVSLGGIPKNKDIALESRHLGLVPAKEMDNTARYEGIRSLVEDNLDLDLMLEIASNAPSWDEVRESPLDAMGQFRLGLARDDSFNFYYQDNLDIMRSLGADIVEFSPTAGDLPAADGYYFGGGYPELHLDELAANNSMKEALAEKVQEDVPVYAECGGMMYLCKSVKGQDGLSRDMTGVFDATVEMTPRLQALGYVEATCVNDCVLSPAGGTVRGHVFHYSRVASHSGERFSYRLSKDKGIDGAADGFTKNNALASYLHLHFGSELRFAEEFAASCLGQKW
ncbi:MAG: cobyrinate a,c-diamide synthase [Methanomassiliicoccus sp.]|nr:cobyrinate a,c-diamide synthase [Methanomassiliicoccus sp.]